MIQFPVDDKAAFCVIEPGNIARLKQGHPITIEFGNGCSVMIAFTPDLVAFAGKLGVVADVQKGERKEKFVHLTPERIQKALDECLKCPEVER